MKKKKIIDIHYPPLIKVILELYFENNIELTLSEATKVFEKINKEYTREPKLVLLPPIKPGEKIDLPIGGLRYSDIDNKKVLQIGRNFIVFSFTEYSRWDELLSHLMKIILNLKDILKVAKINQLYLTYVDEFNVDVEGFSFADNFNVKIEKPENWKIHYHDYYLGIVPFEEKGKKIVLRLKGRGIKDEKYNFTLETAFINKTETIPIEEDNLKSYLDSAHDLIISHFIDLIDNTDLKKKIGMFLEE